MILLCSRGHKIRQDGKRHILKGDGLAMEQLQKMCSVMGNKRSDPIIIKLGIIRTMDAVFQLLLGKVREHAAHYLICHSAVIHFRQLLQRHFHDRDLIRNKESPFICKSLQDRL